MSVKAIVQESEAKMKKAIESATREFNEVRTGRAHPGLIEGLHVDYYGTPTPLKQLASITVPDPKTIVIQPWDMTVIPEIEKMIMNTPSIGVTPTNDGKIIRINVPALSDERRAEMAKVVKDMGEKARVSLRTIRRDGNDKVKKMEGDKTIGEDESFKGQDEIQKLTDRYIKEIDRLVDEKSKALTAH